MIIIMPHLTEKRSNETPYTVRAANSVGIGFNKECQFNTGSFSLKGVCTKEFTVCAVN